MKATYIGHSGILVELEQCYLLFDCVALEKDTEELDYHAGTWPQLLKDKKLYIFVSHFHKDHYSKDIWNLRKEHPYVEYIIDKTVPFSSGVKQKLEISEEDLKQIHRAHANEVFTSADGLVEIDTLKSTDEGVAFFVKAEGKTVFHAGDLNLWVWKEEGDAYCDEMTRNFWNYVKTAKGRRVDLACIILDPRMGETRYAGMDAWRSLIEAEHIIPIHMWKEYALAEQYKKDRKDTEGIDAVCTVSHVGQTWEF